MTTIATYDNHYMTAVRNALKDTDVNISVGDHGEEYLNHGEEYLNLYHSRDVVAIRDNVEAVYAPYIMFYNTNIECLGGISVCSSNGSVIEYHDNDFINSIL